MSRQDLWHITVSVTGIGSLGIFDKKTGGEIAAKETKYKPGGTPLTTSLGGPVEPSNITVERLYVKGDMALLKRVAPLVGRARVTVNVQELAEDYSPYGQSVTYRGVLNKLTFPDTDSNAQAASMVSLEISTDGSVG